MNSSSVSFVDSRNSVSVSAVAPPGGVTEGARDRVHRHDAVLCTDVGLGARADGDVAGRHDREGPVGAALEFEQSPEPRQRRRLRIGFDGCCEVAPDHEVGALAAADLVGDHAAHDVGVLVVGDVEAGILQGDRCRRQLGEHPSANDSWPSTIRQRRGARSSWHSNPRSTTWRNGTSASTSRSARRRRERDVGEPLDIDDLTRQQLDGRAVPRDERERLRVRERRGQGGARGHRRPFIGSGGRSQRERPPSGVCVWDREHTAVSGRATTW